MENSPSTEAAQPQTIEAQNALPGSYAWRRYFARAVDTSIVMGIIIFLLFMTSVIIVALADRQDFANYTRWVKSTQEMNHFIDAFITVALWLPIEALLLCTLGTTPGKWIFGIEVRYQAGGLLSYRTAISRAALVWIMGLGLSIPIVSLITLITSYDRVTKTGTTAWDRDLATTVTYAKMTDGRLAACAVAVILWAIVTAWSVIHYFT